MSSTILITEGLTRRFEDNVAVNDLSLEIQAGEVFGFLGHNGAGKTTTVRLLNGVLEPHSGKIQVFGLEPLRDGPALRARTGVLTESASQDNRLTARENLHIYADLFNVPRSDVAARSAELLELFGLSESADEKVSTFSTGMRQRLALARTLLHEPELLFLDEPTAGLDPVASQQVHELIVNLSQDRKHTVFLCTHNLVEAQKLCDRVAIMEHGRLVVQGKPYELARQYVNRLDVRIETATEQIANALEIVENAKSLVRSAPRRINGALTVTVTGREAIPDLVDLLVGQGIRIYHLAANEPSLEDVYFALHNEKEKEL